MGAALQTSLIKTVNAIHSDVQKHQVHGELSSNSLSLPTWFEFYHLICNRNHLWEEKYHLDQKKDI